MKKPDKKKTSMVDPAKAYVEMEPYLCDVVSMGKIAAQLFDDPDQGLYIFAVTHLEEMLQDLRKRYYASDFPR